MNKKLKMIFILLIFSLNFSCGEKKSKEKKVTKSELHINYQQDTLKFTSGIRAIFQDSKGNYWFGSLQEGIAHYKEKSFQYFTTKDGLSDNQIHSIQEDKDGIIWFNTQTGISSYDGTRITNHVHLNNENVQNSFPAQNKDYVPSNWKKSETDIWFEAGNKSSVYRWDGKEFHYLEFPVPKIINYSDNLFAVTDIATGKNNTIWFSTYAGVFGYNGNNFTILNEEILGLDRKMEPWHIRSIYEDSKGRLWFGNNGIGILCKEGDELYNFSKKHGLVPANSKRNGDKSPQGTLEHIFTIAEDYEGNIWFGDRDAGIWKWNGKQMRNYTKKDGLTNDFALSIYEDPNKVLWFGMANGNIYKFNGKTFEKQF